MPKINNEPIMLHMHEIINNPTGKGSAYLSSRKFIKEDLSRKYKNLLLKHKKFDCKIYTIGDDYVFHIKVPSEKLKDFYYDVVLDFYPDPEIEDVRDDKDLNRYYVKLFSNSPSFTFTYTYVCNKNNMIPKNLKKFCSKEALTQAPTTRNPVETYGYEKSVYFACLYVIEHKLYKKFDIEKTLFKYKKDTFDNTILTQEQKLVEYNKAKKEEANAKRKAKNDKIIKARNEIDKLQKKKTTKRKSSKSSSRKRPNNK